MPIRKLNLIRNRFDKRQLALFLFTAFFSAMTPAGESSRSISEASVENEKNMPVRLGSLKKDREILVLVFVASTCPITNLYWDRIKGAWYNYRERDVSFGVVGGNSDDSTDKIRKRLEAHDMELPLVWDEKHVLAQRIGIEFTPEVVVIGKNWEVMYRGRIDDSWRDEGRARLRYLDAAITAALAGQKTDDHLDDVFMGSRLR